MTKGGARLEVLNVTAEYHGKSALIGVELDVGGGEIVAVIGANGAGKSTLLKAIMGLVAVTRGDIKFDGKSIRNSRTSAIARLGIGYLPQGAPAFVELTVKQNLAIAGLYLGEPELSQQIEQALELFPGLRNRLTQRAGVLSGGERQMLGLARAFIGKPTLLLLDEPSLGLHPDLSKAVFSKIRQLNLRYGTTSLIVEQNVQQVLEISSRVYALKQGQIAAHGDSHAFRSKENLREIFMG
jgi:ABC-type branched-subunit amino acid transport system ATPase component